MDKFRNKKVINWLKSVASNQYKDDIDIMWIYGSHANGTENIFSDIDCYYIPRDIESLHEKKTFMIEGVGYSIEPQTWTDVANLANLRQMFLPCIGVTEIIYSRTDKEEEKFKSMVNQMNSNLQDNELCYEKICQKYAEANEFYGRMLGLDDLTRVRFLAGQVIMLSAYCVALSNNTFFHRGLKKQYEDLKVMKKKPENFTELYDEIIKADSIEEIKKLCRQMLSVTREFYNIDIPVNVQPIPDTRDIKGNAPDYNEMASEYEEYSSIFNKIYYNSVDKNYIVTFLSAVYLQRLLDETCLKNSLPTYSILDKFQYDDLTTIKNFARRVQLDLHSKILAGNGKINEFTTFEEFLANEKNKENDNELNLYDEGER